MRFLGAVVAAAGLAGAACGVAAAKSHDPVPGAPNCHGQLMAISNHASGAYGASGNPRASAGAGYFLGSATHAVVAEITAEVCTAP
jgi:phosphoribosylcarboxyaminoimidazole (NCAIR) mutase